MSALGRWTAADAYARGGLAVLPLHIPDASGTCSCPAHGACPSPGKHPRIAGGVLASSSDPRVVQQWWDRFSDANVGVATGARSGVIVLDVDARHGGVDSLAQLERRHGEFARFGVRTGDGMHLWMAIPEGVRMASSAGRLRPGLDIRGEGGYVVAPPSIHYSGTQYRWIAPFGLSFPPCPDWLVGRLAKLERRDQVRLTDWPPPGRVGRGWVADAVSETLSRVAGAAPGTRNDTLNRSAWRLGLLAGRGLIGPEEVAGPLLDSARSAGLTEPEARATIRSGLRAGIATGAARSGGIEMS